MKTPSIHKYTDKGSKHVKPRTPEDKVKGYNYTIIHDCASWVTRTLQGAQAVRNTLIAFDTAMTEALKH